MSEKKGRRHNMETMNGHVCGMREEDWKNWLMHPFIYVSEVSPTGSWATRLTWPISSGQVVWVVLTPSKFAIHLMATAAKYPPCPAVVPPGHCTHPDEWCLLVWMVIGLRERSWTEYPSFHIALSVHWCPHLTWTPCTQCNSMTVGSLSVLSQTFVSG